MTANSLCPYCKQPLPSKKYGRVYLPPRKAQILGTIDRYPGINALGIIRKCYQGNGTVNAVRVHITQINNLLMENDIRIRIEGHGCYRVVRPEPESSRHV